MDYGHTSYTEMKTGQVTSLPFPSTMMESICRELGFELLTDLGINQVETIFKTSLQKWRVGSMSTEDLSSISNYLLTRIDQSRQLAATMIDASELSYYIRNADTEQAGKTLSDFISRLRDYQNKAL